MLFEFLAQYGTLILPMGFLFLIITWLTRKWGLPGFVHPVLLTLVILGWALINDVYYIVIFSTFTMCFFRIAQKVLNSIKFAGSLFATIATLIHTIPVWIVIFAKPQTDLEWIAVMSGLLSAELISGLINMPD